MNWEAIGAVAEIVGATAVVASLLYLSVQVRQNTAAATTQTYDSVIAGFNSVNALVIAKDEVAGIFQRGTTDPSSLSDSEAIRFAFLMRSWSNQWLKLLRLRQRGALSQAEWEPFAHEAAEAFRTPGGKLFRAENQVFNDLYTELDKYGGFAISAVRLGGKGADPRPRLAETQ
jgi:hypothetical protein